MLRAMGDLRLGQRWSTVQRVRNGAWYHAAVAALAVARWAPGRALPAMGRALGTAAWCALGSYRRAADARLMQAFGQPTVGSLEVFRGLGEDLADAVRLMRAEEPVERRLALSAEAEEVLREALSEGKGVVFVTAHLGPMERMAALVASRGFEVVTLARESYDPRFTTLYERLRASRGVRTIYRGRAGAEVAIVRALRGGSLVGFPMDLAGRGMECATVELLGAPHLVPLGPARIALRTGAAVVAGTPGPGPEGLRVFVTRLKVAPEMTEQELTRRCASELEARIRAWPAHWPWMHARSSARQDASP
jgi:Kdo2-lipid IVA lauroyltransferase/acyltransferase